MLTKVATDQLLFTPVGISLFYGTLATLEGRPEETPQVLLAEAHGCSQPSVADMQYQTHQVCMETHFRPSTADHSREAGEDDAIRLLCLASGARHQLPLCAI